ncbi:MAG: 3'-5' exonuclease [Candidatus Thermoplasmatota archaeon]
MQLFAFDLETTGLDGNTARIVEFCFIELDAADPGLRELSRWSELVDPQMAIPPETTRVHGITDEMVRGKPAFAALAPRIQAIVQEAVLVAHNHKYDLEILSRELVRAGQPGLRPNHPCIDTQRVESTVNSHGLAATYERYHGKPFDGAHRSQADTEACVAVLRAQRATHAAKLPADLEELIVANLERRRNPERADRTWLDHGRKFYADAAGTIFYNFGKFRGQAIFASKETKDYLSWMRDKADFPDDIRALLVSWIGPRPSPQP